MIQYDSIFSFSNKSTVLEEIHDGEPRGSGCSELVVGAESHDSDSEYYTADEGEPCVGTTCSEDHLELDMRPQKRLKLM